MGGNPDDAANHSLSSRSLFSLIIHIVPLKTDNDGIAALTSLPLNLSSPNSTSFFNIVEVMTIIMHIGNHPKLASQSLTHLIMHCFAPWMSKQAAKRSPNFGICSLENSIDESYIYYISSLR